MVYNLPMNPAALESVAEAEGLVLQQVGALPDETAVLYSVRPRSD